MSGHVFSAVQQSALDPAGPQAERIGDVWWLMFWVCAVVMALVTLALLGGLLHARRRRESEAPQPIAPESHRRMTWVVSGALATTAVILLVLLAASVSTGRALGSLTSPDALVIEVIGRQWWWEVRYMDDQPSNILTDANEIHIPVGRPVLIRGTSRDVIHSLWVPNLHGKKDLIPGYVTDTWIQADRPGVFRGQCAEFCGLQHAHMAFLVVAEPPAKFQAWRAAASQPARPPRTPLELRGQQVFLNRQCALCHTVLGTDAGGRIGPDLTHVASRRTLGAGTLPNTRGHLAGWIVDPQSVKPGNRMPQNPMPSEDLLALLAYLESLQ
ncbi:MAG TPA: cytochrome c oxidase subunit II [Thermoanaerobaculia bacterium]